MGEKSGEAGLGSSLPLTALQERGVSLFHVT